MEAFLNRSIRSKVSTLGVLSVFDGSNKVYECKTLELPWLKNARQKSCIPTGKFQVIYAPPTTKFPYPHFRLLNVPGRDGILMHRGCFTSQTLGCILVGTDWGDLNKDGQTDLQNSGAALTRLYELFGEKPWDLFISGE